MIKQTTIIYIMSAGLIFTACTQEGPDISKGFSPAAQAEIEKRSEHYRKQKLAECRANTLEKASQHVDSIILEQALFIGGDTLPRPLIPERPERESFYSNIEKLSVKPFLTREDFVSPFQKGDTIVLDNIQLDSIQKSKELEKKKKKSTQ